MPGFVEYLIFTVVGVAMCLGGAHAADNRDYMHNGYWPEGGMRSVFIGCAVVGGCMAIAGLIAIFCVITSSVVS